MSKARIIQPEMVKYKDNDYNTIARFPYGVLGSRLLDKCCEDLVLIKRSGETIRVVGETKSARTKIVRIAAEFCISTSEVFHENGGVDSDWALPDGQLSKPFLPKTVPGTSGGSVYKVLAMLGAGSVSYNHGSLTEPHRMRVALWPELVTGDYFWNAKDKQLSDKYLSPVFNTVEPTHMSFTPNKINQAIVVLARGMDALLHVQTIL